MLKPENLDRNRFQLFGTELRNGNFETELKLFPKFNFMLLLTLSDLHRTQQFSELVSIPDIFQDSKGSYYCLKRVENSLASDSYSTLTSLKHPCLLSYHVASETAVEFCQFGSLENLLQAGHRLSLFDFWCILTQLIHLSDFLSNLGLKLNDLDPSRVFVSSLNPIRIKASLYYNSKLAIIPFQTSF
ncbi:hypothetical protein RCL1_001534 [Eukaryota sp. TZLM3-RCL]